MDSISEIMQENGDDLSQFQNQSTTQKNDNQGKNPQNLKDKIRNKPKSKPDQQNGVSKKIQEKPINTKQTDQTTGVDKNKSKLSTKLDKIAVKLDRIISLLQQSSSDPNTTGQKQTQVVDELEGVFDGKHMIGSDTNKYEVPYEFTNEKNLVEGDLLKLIIKSDGSYSYEVLEAVERKRLVGTVKQDEQNGWSVQVESDQFKLRNDFIEQKDIEVGDKVVILVPKHGKSNWGVLENVF